MADDQKHPENPTTAAAEEGAGFINLTFPTVAKVIVAILKAHDGKICMCPTCTATTVRAAVLDLAVFWGAAPRVASTCFDPEANPDAIDPPAGAPGLPNWREETAIALVSALGQQVAADRLDHAATINALGIAMDEFERKFARLDEEKRKAAGAPLH